MANTKTPKVAPRFTPTTESAGGTSLTGYLTCSYKALKKAFGKPIAGDGYKVSTEFVILDTTYKQVITLYDYKVTKLYDSTGMSVAAFRKLPHFEWHLGSKGPIDINALCAFIESKTGEKCSAFINR
jgi:hypothetical protein